MNIIGGRMDGYYDYDDGNTRIHRKLTDEEIATILQKDNFIFTP